MLLHLAAVAANTVVATPVPTPSPEIVRQTINNSITQYQTPALVLQLAHMAAVFASALVLSVAHAVLEFVTAREKGWGPKVNTLVASVYSLGVGVVGAATMTKMSVDLSALTALAYNSFPALAGAFWTYALRTKLFAGLNRVRLSVEVKNSVNEAASKVASTKVPVTQIETAPSGQEGVG